MDIRSITESPNHARANKKIPAKVKPTKGHESPHPLDGKAVGESDDPMSAMNDYAAKYKAKRGIDDQADKFSPKSKEYMVHVLSGLQGRDPKTLNRMKADVIYAMLQDELGDKEANRIAFGEAQERKSPFLGRRVSSGGKKGTIVSGEYKKDSTGGYQVHTVEYDDGSTGRMRSMKGHTFIDTNGLDEAEEPKSAHARQRVASTLKAKKGGAHADKSRKVGRKAKHKGQSMGESTKDALHRDLQQVKSQLKMLRGNVPKGGESSIAVIDKREKLLKREKEIIAKLKSNSQEVMEAPMAISMKNAGEFLHSLVDDFVNDAPGEADMQQLVKALGRNASVKDGRIVVQPKGRASFSIDDSEGRGPGHNMQRRGADPMSSDQHAAADRILKSKNNSWTLESAQQPLSESRLMEAIRLDDLKAEVVQAVKSNDAAAAAQLKDEIKDRHKALQQHLGYNVGGEKEIPVALQTLKQMFAALKKIA